MKKLLLFALLAIGFGSLNAHFFNHCCPSQYGTRIIDESPWQLVYPGEPDIAEETSTGYHLVYPK